MNHPSYDRFWQKWLPFGDEFAGVDIPVLTVTGYYSAGETAALYYFTQHHRARCERRSCLADRPVRRAQRRARRFVLGSRARSRPGRAHRPERRALRMVRACARRGGAAGASLSANVNYELAGANEWRHEPSLEALESKPLRFYLEASPSGAPHALAAEKSAAPMSLTETVDLRDRGDADWRPAQELDLDGIAAARGRAIRDGALRRAVDVAGRLRGVLDFTINKYDVDLVVTLYELRAERRIREAVRPRLCLPCELRAGPRPAPPAPGGRQAATTVSERENGGPHGSQAGSRLALALGINKRADQQINYGGTHDVSEESIEDAGAADPDPLARRQLHRNSVAVSGERAASPLLGRARAAGASAVQLSRGGPSTAARRGSAPRPRRARLAHARGRSPRACR